MKKILLSALSALCLGSLAALGDVDITALGRTEFTPTITRVSGTVRKTTEDVNHAFDGDKGKDGRVMFTSSTGVIQYDIPDDYNSGAEFTLTSYTLTRTSSDDTYDLPRAPTQFKLEALDGTTWVTLHEKTSSDPESSWSSSVKEVSYEIPSANRVASRSYRFSALANNGSTHEVPLSLNDLTFYGEVSGGVQIVEEAALVSACGIEKELYFENRKLSDVQDLALTCKQGFGGSQDERDYRWSLPRVASGTFADSGLYLLSNDGTTLTVEFHGRTYGSAYDGVGNGFLLQLTQEGDDIYGQVMWAAGFTGAQTFGYDVSWEPKKSSNILNHYNTTELYHSYGRNLRLYFSDASSQERTVYFKGKDGETIKTYVVQPGAYAAVGPTDAEMPDYGSNWVFLGWDTPFDNVQKIELTVTALYHKLCTVTFMGGVDGQTQLDQQTVEQTYAATAPEAPAIPNYVFLNWDTDFSSIADDLVVTAVYDRTYQVVFKDPDGTVVDTQTIRTGFAATAPDMTGAEYKGLPFFAWEGDFSCVTSDLEIVAYYGLRPDFAKHFTVTVPANYSQGSCSTYPILVRMSETGIVGFDYDDFQLGGRDLYVEDALGNALPYELAVWDTAGESLLYVQVTSALEGTDITVYYGGTMACESPAGMWAGYVGVWHFEEDSGDAADSTGHGLTATPHGTTAQMVASTDAAIGRSRVNATATGTTNGMGVSKDINDYITTASAFTVEGWFKATGVSGYTRVFSRKNGYSDAKGWEIEYNSDSKTSGKLTGAGGDPRLEFQTADTTLGWQKLTYVVNGDTASVYTNGALSASGSIATVQAADVGFAICNDADFNERQWWGLVDEVKFYDDVKSAEQIAFEYAQDTDAVPLVYGVATASDTSKPDLATVSVTSADGESMTVSLGFTTLGDDADSGEAYIAYGLDADHLGTPVKFAEGTSSPIAGTISNLTACAIYAYSVYIENDQGQVSETKTGSFRVAAPTTPVSGTFAVPGLLQGKLNTANDFETDILKNSVIDLEVVPGVVMANYKVGDGQQNSIFYTNPSNGHEYKWNGSNTTFGYYGEIYLAVGELHIGKNIDDSAYVKIGDTVVLNDTTYNVFPVATFTVTETGWYPLEVRLGDGSGGKGLYDTSKFENNGLAYNINGTTDPSAKGWAPFMDDNGSFLRYGEAGAEAYLAIGSVSDDADGTVTAWISVDAPVPVAAKVVAFYGAEDMGDNAAMWYNRVVLANLAKGETLPSTKFEIPDLAKNAAVRFALVGEATASTSALARFSGLYEYEQILPLVSLDIGEIAEEGVAAMMHIGAFGTGASSGTLKLEYSLTADFASSGFISVGTYTEPQTVNVTITTLAPATTYFVRAVLENSEGESNVSDAVQFTTYNSAIAHPGEILTWIGGATGTWDDSTANWRNPNGYAVVWLDGCTAKFDESAAVTLSGGKSVIGIETAGDVVLAGSAITFTSPATIVHNDGGTLRFENDVTGKDGLVLDTNRAPNYLPLGEENAVKIYSDCDLAEIDTSSIKAVIHYNRANNNENVATIFVIGDGESKAGINYFERGDGRLVFQCRILYTDWYNNPCIAKVVLQQVGSDVYGYIEKAECLENVGNNVSIDVTNGTHHHLTPDTAAITPMDGAASWRIGVANIIFGDIDPLQNATTAFAGDYQATGEIAVNSGAFRVVGEGTMFGGDFTASGDSVTTPLILGDNGTFEFDSTATQLFAMMVNGRNANSGYSTIKIASTKGRFVIGPNARNVTLKCSSEGMHRIYNAVDVYGTVTLAKGTYHLLYQNTYGIFVYDGGVLNMNSFLNDYGLRSARVTCYEGGTINCPDVWSLGSGGSSEPLTLDGGVVHMTKDYSENLGADIKQTALIMKNGALIDGVMMTWARGENTLTVDGTEPSSVELEKIRFGQRSNASSTKMLEKLVVNDVTGDDEVDLTVSSELYINGGATWDVSSATNLGFVKDGAGTLLLTGVSPDFGGSVTMKSGTLAFSSTSKLSGAVLNVTGNATLALERGAEVSFLDSSTIAWTAGATLDIEGNLYGHSLRFGTNTNGLTAAQLASISYKGTFGNVYLDENGYLHTHDATVILFR